VGKLGDQRDLRSEVGVRFTVARDGMKIAQHEEWVRYLGEKGRGLTGEEGVGTCGCGSQAWGDTTGPATIRLPISRALVPCLQRRSGGGGTPLVML